MKDPSIDEYCGVHFDPLKDFGVDVRGSIDTENGEPAGQCKDEECVDQKRQSEAETKLGSMRGDEIPGGDVESTGARVSVGSSSGASPAPPPPDPPYQGLPPDYFKKHYRPDYPDDLQMTITCMMKEANEGSGSTRTHPKPTFYPYDPSAATMKKRGTEAQPQAVMDSPSQPDLNDIWSEPSPLQQNRQLPPVTSSADEAIVNW